MQSVVNLFWNDALIIEGIVSTKVFSYADDCNWQRYTLFVDVSFDLDWRVIQAYESTNKALKSCLSWLQGIENVQIFLFARKWRYNLFFGYVSSIFKKIADNLSELNLDKIITMNKIRLAGVCENKGYPETVLWPKTIPNVLVIL